MSLILSVNRHTLVVVGHGSHFNVMSSAPVFQHAERIRQSGEFDEVRTGFWKEEPALCRVLDGCTSERVTVVPLFMSHGYFSEDIIPREMRLDGPITSRDGQRIFCARPVGSHPFLVDVLIQRAEEVGADAQTAIVVLGHGTSRNPRSEETIRLQSQWLRERARFAEVCTLFLDQEPGLDQVWSLCSARNIAVVPLFVADGWHVTETIPDDLNLMGGGNRQRGRCLRFARAVGTHPKVAEVVRALALENS